MNEEGSPVSNAGPLMVLAKLNVLHLLKELFSRVRIPRSVYDEAVTEGLRQGYEDARTLQIFLEQTGWLPEEVDETAIPLALHKSPLDRGERDAIGLAITLGKGVVLIDEMVGRKVAQEQGVFVCGSLRILIEAYRRELIGVDQLRLYFAEIAGRHDIWINPELVKRLEQEVFGNLE